jgi:acyl-CoA synthetase (AMP-forming)/AMP-acid ligase II
MILGESDRAGEPRTTLDDLFRRAGVRRPDALALADAPNRQAVTGGAPRQLTFAQADRAIAAMATRLRDHGLQTDTVVAIQLAHTVDSVIALLGVLRAGMIAVPVPLLWREQDLVDALRRIGAKAIITAARIGNAAHAEIAMQTAVELFPIRYVCGFGPDLPDGVVPLDDIYTRSDTATAAARPGNPAAHVAVITFDVGPEGPVAVARNPKPMALWATLIAVMIAAGFATMLVGLIVAFPLIGHATWHAYQGIYGAPRS